MQLLAASLDQHGPAEDTLAADIERRIANVDSDMIAIEHLTEDQ